MRSLKEKLAKLVSLAQINYLYTSFLMSRNSFVFLVPRFFIVFCIHLFCSAYSNCCYCNQCMHYILFMLVHHCCSALHSQDPVRRPILSFSPALMIVSMHCLTSNNEKVKSPLFTYVTCLNPTNPDALFTSCLDSATKGLNAVARLLHVCGTMWHNVANNCFS